MIEITNKDIDIIEEIILPKGCHFNKSHRKVIQNLETIDIKACPGSGKTTSLIAKLLIIEKNLPLENNRAVCVLSHTNVGINEIKSRSQDLKGGILFQYPNHISTIQVFVNKYLAIPSYKHFFNDKIFCIDNDTYKENFLTIFYKKVPRNYRINIERKYSVNDLVEQLVYNLDDDGEIYLGKKKLSDIYSESTQSFQYLKQVKDYLLNSGILSFQDAYYLAFKFLRKFPEIKNIISSRFEYLFIDEMQDTSQAQLHIINNTFDSTKVKMQFIGDINQAIFGSYSEKSGWKPSSNSLLLSDSKRFSESIAKCIDKIAVKPQNVKGNEQIIEIKPKLLVFNQSNIENVLKYFSEIIIQNNLHQIENAIFKAVGRVGKKHPEGKITIPSYFPLFNKDNSKNVKTRYNSLQEYIVALQRFEQNGVSESRRIFVNLLLHSLRIENIKVSDNWYSEKTLLMVLSERNEILIPNLNRKIAKWLLEISNNISIEKEVADFILNIFVPFMNGGNKEVSSLLKEFCSFNPVKIARVQDIKEHEPINTFIFTADNKDKIPVILDTVYNVKGETHAATLYLETYYKKYDLERIIEYLKQNHFVPTGKDLSDALSIAYVGMTRPSHLLCLAISEDTINGHEEELKKAGWEIRYVPN